ncbi:sugar kinase [Candidatus Micrarchaeota archaeon]|nr:sugar kinase [Candidatus Micrarchaeota archaeon]
MIVCTGSIALDTTRTPFAVYERQLGGAASFFSYGASFFSKTHLVGCVGDDFPVEHWRFLEKKGVAMDGVQKGGKTFFVDWNYGFDLQARTTNKLELNCMQDFKPVVPKAWRGHDFVYLGTLPPKQQLSVLEQMEDPKFSMLDTIEFYIQNDRRNLDRVVSAVDSVLLNDVEARMLADTPNLVKAAKYVLDLGPKLVLIKKGEHGALLFSKDFILPSPAFPLEEVVDPTGAGDSFAAGFLGHLTQCKTWDVSSYKKAMAFGHVMGSLAVEDFGLKRLASVSRKDIDERFGLYQRMVSF